MKSMCVAYACVTLINANQVNVFVSAFLLLLLKTSLLLAGALCLIYIYSYVGICINIMYILWS